MRLGCILFLLLFTIPLLVMSPLVIDPASFPGPIADGFSFLLCGSDKTYVRETYRDSYHRPGEVGVNFHCEDENGERSDATGRFVLMVMIGFATPILLVVFFGVFKTKTLVQYMSKQAATHQGRTTSTSFHWTNANPSTSRTDGSLSDQLKQLQQAYEDRLITREEYDTARQKLLDRLSD